MFGLSLVGPPWIYKPLLVKAIPVALASSLDYPTVSDEVFQNFLG